MKREREEEYLEAIYKLQERGQAVTAVALARELGISASAASAVLHRLIEAGLVQHPEGERRAAPPTLTPRGLRQAASVVRRHRLAERLLTDVLGMSWDRTHDEACKLEHILSPEVEERLSAVLGHPETCPHGYPVPGGEHIQLPAAQPLSALPPASRAVIVRVAHEDAGLLRYLANLGLMPQRELTVEQHAPFDGPVMVKVGGAHYALGKDVAEQIMVRSLGELPA